MPHVTNKNMGHAVILSFREFDDNMDATLGTATLAVSKVKLTIYNFLFMLS